MTMRRSLALLAVAALAAIGSGRPIRRAFASDPRGMRRTILALGAAALAAIGLIGVGRGAGQVHRRAVDDVDAELGPLRTHPADVHQQDRNRGPCRGGRYRPGDQERRERRRRRPARALPGGGREVRGGWPRSGAPRRDVQRLRHRRSALGPRGHRRHDRRGRGADEDCRGRSAVRITRRRQRHQQGGARALGGGRNRTWRRPRAAGTARPARAWARRSTSASAWAPTS